MTRDELLDKFEDIEYWQEQYAGKTFLKALRAVLELHKPKQFEVNPDEYKTICSVCPDVWAGGEYPCPTIQVIERELA